MKMLMDLVTMMESTELVSQNQEPPAKERVYSAKHLQLRHTSPDRSTRDHPSKNYPYELWKSIQLSSESLTWHPMDVKHFHHTKLPKIQKGYRAAVDIRSLLLGRAAKSMHYHQQRHHQDKEWIALQGLAQRLH
jgi:hypothetical protein